MKQYVDKNTGEVTVLVEDLGFLYDREHFSWFKRHIYNILHKRALKKAGRIVAVNDEVRAEINRYYSVPKQKISLLQDQGWQC